MASRNDHYKIADLDPRTNYPGLNSKTGNPNGDRILKKAETGIWYCST